MKKFCFLLFFVCFQVLGTNYYVRTDGADTNNGLTNTTGGAWLTINKALGASGIPTTGGPHTLNINTGTYAESTQLSLGRAYGTVTTVQTTTGSKDVVITGASGNYNVLQNGAISHLWFTNLVFNTRSGSLYLIGIYTGVGDTVSDLLFWNCDFNGDAAAKSLVEPLNGASNPAQVIGFSGCTFYAFATNYPAIYLPNFSYATNCTINITNCTVSSPYAAAVFLAGTANLSGTKLTAIYNKGLEFGVDGNSGSAVTGSATSCTVSSLLQHALLVGAGATGVTLTATTVYGGNLGLVLKACSLCTISNVSALGGSVGPLLVKGASNNIITKSIFVSDSSEPALANYDGDSTYKSGTNTITYNRFTASQSGYIWKWDTSGDNGGNVIDYNIYEKLGTSSYYGYIGSSSSSLTSLVGAQAAWAGTSNPSSNDQHSRDLTTPIEFASPF